MQVAVPVSKPLETFLRERLPSMEQVEIVLMLRRDASKAWSAPEVSKELGTPPESAAMRLFLLASNGILAFEGAGGLPKYRYACADPAFDSMVAELEEVHRSDPDALREIVGGAPRDPLRTFADAFRLKK